MQLVLTPIFTKEDVEAIKQGLITKEKKIEDNWIHGWDSIKDKFKNNSSKNKPKEDKSSAKKKAPSILSKIKALTLKKSK